MTPELEDRLCLTATLTGSYAAAAQLAAKWAVPWMMRPSAPMCGKWAGVPRRRCWNGWPPPPARRRQWPWREQAAPFPWSSLMDGWLARQRGEDWAAPPAPRSSNRVAWREIKGAVIYRLDQAGATAGGRGRSRKSMWWPGKATPGIWSAGANRARRRGLASAREVFVVVDGRRLALGTFRETGLARRKGMLDFYHASEHLWAVARSLYPGDETAARAWVRTAIKPVEAWAGSSNNSTICQPGAPPRAVRCRRKWTRERAYVQNHREPIDYEAMAAQGCPNGSGAMESFCSPLQGRFKRCGQF